MMSIIKRAFVATALCTTLWLAGCNPPSWFKTADSLTSVAEVIITNLVINLKPGTSLASIAKKVQTDYSTLNNALNLYIQQPTGTALTDIQAGFTVLTTDETDLLAAFNVSNQNSDATIRAVIAALDEGFSELASLIPPQAASTLSPEIQKQIKKAKLTGTRHWSADDFKGAYNHAVKGDKRFKTLSTSPLSVL